MPTPRDDGCTLTGALSVTTEIRDCATIIHGPAGCAHHNFSLLHALHAARDRVAPPALISTDMSEKEVIFGGEPLLEETLLQALSHHPEIVCVLSTCVAATIGDDVEAICRVPRTTPVLHIPTGGFLGGGFLSGHMEALRALSRLAANGEKALSVNLIGEKTLEYEVSEHFREVSRILQSMGVPVNARFVCATSVPEIRRLGNASLNILRDPSMIPLGRSLEDDLGIPFIESFPLGMEGTLRFMEEVGEALSIETSHAIANEEALQHEMVRTFSSLKGKRVRFSTQYPADGSSRLGYELADLFDLEVHEEGNPVPVPDPFPVGTNGIRRLLHRWKRGCHA
ncbi:MAG: light-independent protochlorophyllide reductase subunit B [Methanoregulaceae archaeon PtaB.Bin108]|nr:MAG: light-independent protochlorophyllide reductase subunit B [Methanoregulaceae archaeon PtaB.Bin108]